MTPPKPTKKSKGQKKEKVFHPQSRKADQLVRTQLRKGKLQQIAKVRNQKQNKQVDLYGFFYHAIPEEGVLTLEDVHMMTREIWLKRFDSELEAERAARRKGRPKSLKEMKLEEQKLRESDEYRTGIEVVDLTHPVNVELFRQWDQKEVAYVQQLRFIRISSAAPEVARISRPGRHPLLIEKQEDNVGETQEVMEIDTEEAPLLQEPMSRFSSTMTTMDIIP